MERRPLRLKFITVLGNIGLVISILFLTFKLILIMAINGNEGAPIALATAKRWTASYRQNEEQNNPGETVTKAHFFGKEKILEVLKQEECVGMRIYYGINDDKKREVIIVGTKSDENNILPSNEDNADSGSGIVLDDSVWCPPFCPDPPDGL